MTEPGDLTSRVLEAIREELRGHTAILKDHTAILTQHTRILERHTQQFDVMNERILAVETTMQELAEQMVMLVHAVRTTVVGRVGQDERIEDHERRLAKLESLVLSSE
jgi:hypothetical protein